MMKMYYVEFWTTDGQKVGMQISAYNALEARLYAEKMPDFRMMVCTPKEM